MHRTTLRVLVFLVAVGTPYHTGASTPMPPEDSTTTLAADTARVSVRQPPDTLLARFQGDPAFEYDRTSGWTWWRDLRRWVRAQLARVFGTRSAGGRVLEFAVYLALALLVGYAVYMLVQLRSEARSPGRMDPELVADPKTTEEMHAIDFDARVEVAVSDGQYRRAVRLLYQQALQRLDWAGVITWHPGKTNRAYVNELDADLRSAFASLTDLFERIWYGGAPVQADRLREIRAQFESFYDRIPALEDGPSTGDMPPAASVSRGTPSSDPDAV